MNLWSCEELRKDFKDLPIMALEKRQSEEKYSHNNLSNNTDNTVSASEMDRCIKHGTQRQESKVASSTSHSEHESELLPGSGARVHFPNVVPDQLASVRSSLSGQWWNQARSHVL